MVPTSLLNPSAIPFAAWHSKKKWRIHSRLRLIVLMTPFNPVIPLSDALASLLNSLFSPIVLVLALKDHLNSSLRIYAAVSSTFSSFPQWREDRSASDLGVLCSVRRQGCHHRPALLTSSDNWIFGIPSWRGDSDAHWTYAADALFGREAG
jgi:hypothetical protein